MRGWILILIGYLVGSFFGIGSVLRLFGRGSSAY